MFGACEYQHSMFEVLMVGAQIQVQEFNYHFHMDVTSVQC